MRATNKVDSLKVENDSLRKKLDVKVEIKK